MDDGNGFRMTNPNVFGPHIPVIALSGEYVAVGIPAELLMDTFLQKGGYTQQLFDAIRWLLADSPIRPHSPTSDTAPLGFRVGTDYIVASCTECLRSFPVDDKSTGMQVSEAVCSF
jgi:hypothetical protein